MHQRLVIKDGETRPSFWSRIAPAFLLVVMAPLVAEVLPGATRFSSMFVFPIEMCVWGGGALLIRYAIRTFDLSWASMLMMALALSIAEECVIQQTSLAPLVIQLRGQTYAREFGVNYVYFLWAMFYETVFVVFVPIYLVELIFPARKDAWIGRIGVVVASFFFLAGSLVAWYLWTHIVRLNVFHVALYDPPIITEFIALTAIGALVYFSLAKRNVRREIDATSSRIPSPWLVAIAGLVCATILYGLLLLGFGINPNFPPLLAVLIELSLSLIALTSFRRWSINRNWTPIHTFAAISGLTVGNMAVMFFGFVSALPRDLYFKIVADSFAIIFLIFLFLRIRARPI